MIKAYEKPSQYVMSKFEDTEAGRISEVLETGRDYEVQCYRLRGADYNLYDIVRAENYACACVLARRFVETGSAEA